MSDQKRKFKGTRKRVRRNLEKEKGKVKRTIFLDDDDIPSTSRGTDHQHKNTTKHKKSANFKPGGSKSARPTFMITNHRFRLRTTFIIANLQIHHK